MNLSELFIKRPVMTGLLMIGILAFGILAYRQLPVSALPNVDFPTIQVSAVLPGASPETMAAAVALPLEKEFSLIAGVDSMTSTSIVGTSQITIQFNLERNIDAEVFPGKLRGVADRQDLDRPDAAIDGVALDRHVAREAPVDRVETQQKRVGLRRRKVVDGDDCDVLALALDDGAQDIAADAAKAINRNSNRHSRLLCLFRNRLRRISRR